MEYLVELKGQAVGRAQIQRQGLYYSVTCRCNLPGDGMYRLVARCGEKQADLGILIPVERGFGLETKFPVRRIGEGELSFRIFPKEQAATERRFVPIHPEEPFAYLSRLKTAVLEEREGQLGASLPETDDQ